MFSFLQFALEVKSGKCVEVHAQAPVQTEHPCALSSVCRSVNVQAGHLIGVRKNKCALMGLSAQVCELKLPTAGKKEKFWFFYKTDII